jgi:hypothetical protein
MRTYIGYQSTTSSDIQNSNNSIIADFNNKFTTAIDYSKLDNGNTLFQKSALLFKTGLGKDNQIIKQNPAKNKSNSSSS